MDIFVKNLPDNSPLIFCVIISAGGLESSKIAPMINPGIQTFSVPMVCPLCFSISMFFQSGENREYRICSLCRLIFVPPKYFLSRQEETSHYLKHENSLDNQGYVEMFQKKINLIKNVCPEVKTVLDYGCGYEPVLKTLLQRENFQARGYDPIFFPDENIDRHFDLIISTETFEHFKEPGKELDSLVAKLAPGGYLAVMTRLYPNHRGNPSNEGFKTWYYKRDPTHVAFFAEGTFSWITAHWCFTQVFNNKIDFVILQKNFL